MPVGWKIVEQRRRKAKPEPRAYVSLNARGELAMNAEAFYQIDEPATVTVLYNAKRRVIGVKFPVSADANFFRVRRYGRGRRMRIVRASRLLKQFGITIGRTLVFENVDVSEYKGSRMLILPLDEAGEVTIRRRSGAHLQEKAR